MRQAAEALKWVLTGSSLRLMALLLFIVLLWSSTCSALSLPDEGECLFINQSFNTVAEHFFSALELPHPFICYRGFRVHRINVDTFNS